MKRERGSGDILREDFCVFVEISFSVWYGSAGAEKGTVLLFWGLFTFPLSSDTIDFLLVLMNDL